MDLEIIIIKIVKDLLVVTLTMFLALLIWNYLYENYLKSRIHKIKGTFKSSIYFYVLGILSVGSSMIWYPILSELYKEGVRIKDIALFIFARAIKPLLIPMQLHFLGWKITLFMNVYLAVISPIAAWLTEKIIEKLNP